MMFHQHRWVTTGVYFNPPVRPASIETRDNDLLLLAFQGFTNVTQTCTGCGRVSTEQHPGQVDVEVTDPALADVARATREAAES